MKIEAFIIGWIGFTVVNNTVIKPEWNNEEFFVIISIGLLIGFVVQTVRVYRRRIK